jgi:hypothetical protein
MYSAGGSGGDSKGGGDDNGGGSEEKAVAQLEAEKVAMAIQHVCFPI